MFAAFSVRTDWLSEVWSEKKWYYCKNIILEAAYDIHLDVIKYVMKNMQVPSFQETIEIIKRNEKLKEKMTELNESWKEISSHIKIEEDLASPEIMIIRKMKLLSMNIVGKKLNIHFQNIHNHKIFVTILTLFLNRRGIEGHA